MVVAAIVGLHLYGAEHVLSVATLGDRRAGLEAFVALHPVLAALAFAVATALYLLLSLPAEGLLTAAGGWLFGTVAGTALSVLGTVLAALLLFGALRRTLPSRVAALRCERVERIRRRLGRDSVNYLLILRLVPVLPFALVSLLAVMARMRWLPYWLATAAGVVPPTLVFASAGSGLGKLLANPGPVDPGDLLSARILLPLGGLACLALLPVALRLWRDDAGRDRSAIEE
ncbi:MAG: VTT domain-containing protein [Acetobacteraceae bacterium]|nr:VTT domain-containing protein [Acetobacteraceae bacterium]